MTTPSMGLLAGFDEDTLHRRTECEPYARLWQYLVERWRGVAARQQESGKVLEQGHNGWASITPMLIEAAFIHRLTGDAAALAYVEQGIQRVADTYQGLTDLSELGRGVPIHSHVSVALAADLCRDSLSAAQLDTVRRIMRLACAYTNFDASPAGYGNGGNIRLCQAVDAGICALVWGEDASFGEWEWVADQAVDACRQYLRRGCDTEGFSFEGVAYGHGVFEFIYLYVQLLKQRRRCDLFATEPALARIPDASRQMLFPDAGSLGSINDAGTRSPYAIPWLHLTARIYNRPHDLGFWEAFSGPDHSTKPWGDLWPYHARLLGEDERYIQHCDHTLMLTFLWWDADAPVMPLEACPLPTAACAYGTGTATFRTSWGRDAVFLNVLGAGRSHTCHGHAHADCGHFNLFAHGEYLAIDTGRYNEPESQHSVVLVDGDEDRHTSEGLWTYCRRAGQLLGFQRHPMLDYVKADAAHIKECRWADRHFLFVRLAGDDAYVVILDNIYPDEKVHDFWWQLQANPSCRVELTGPRAAQVLGEQARLDLTFCTAEPAVEPAYERSDIALAADENWWVWPYGKDEDTRPYEAIGLMSTSVHRPRLLAKRRAENPMFATVIVPRRKGAPSLAVESVSTKGLIRMRVRGNGFTDTLIAALDTGYINIDEAYGLTELALIRRDDAGKVLGLWTVDGEHLALR